MFKSLVIILGFLSSLFCTAQENFDYQWVVGYPDVPNNPKYGAQLMDFNDGDLKFIKIPQASLVTHNSTASICDKDGKLILYSNGCQIHNGDFELVEGCENINPGDAWDSYCDDQFPSYPSAQSQVFLPFPGKDNQYLYLAYRRTFEFGGDEFFNTQFYAASVIDMSLNNGKGKSIQKFEIEYPSNIKAYNLSACKHSNGKDWWIFNFSFDKQKIYRLLLTENGLEGPFEQNGGPPLDSISLGQAVFSPDGKKFATVFSNNGTAWVMDFDRKTGLFSNKQEINYKIKKGWAERGICFSLNSQYVYVSADYYMYQFDAIAPNIQASKILLDSNDGYKFPEHPIKVSFGLCQLGPEGKIYVGHYGGSCRQWSTVEKPNEAGVDCEFKQHSITIPTFSIGSPPIQPHFRLGKDTTSSSKDIIELIPEMKSWYNPNNKTITSWIQQITSQGSLLVNVVDITGRVLTQQKIGTNEFQHEMKINAEVLVPGIYFVQLISEGNLIGINKVNVF